MFLPWKFRFSNAAVVLAFVVEIHTKTHKFFFKFKIHSEKHIISFWREKSRFSQTLLSFLLFLFTFLEFFHDWNWAERTGPPVADACTQSWAESCSSAEQIGLSFSASLSSFAPTCGTTSLWCWTCLRPKISAKKWSANQSPQPIKKKPHSKNNSDVTILFRENDDEESDCFWRAFYVFVVLWRQVFKISPDDKKHW